MDEKNTLNFILELQKYRVFHSQEQELEKAKKRLLTQFTQLKNGYFFFDMKLYDGSIYIMLRPIMDFSTFLHRKKESTFSDHLVFILKNHPEELSVFFHSGKKTLISFDLDFNKQYLLKAYLANINYEGLKKVEQFLKEGNRGYSLFQNDFSDYRIVPLQAPNFYCLDLKKNMKENATQDEFTAYFFDEIPASEDIYQQLLYAYYLYQKLLFLRQDYYLLRLKYQKVIPNAFNLTTKQIMMKILKGNFNV